MSSARIGPGKKAKLTAAELPSNEFVSLHGFLGGPVVHICVGKEGKQYQIPKGYLCRHSEYFRALFEGGFKEQNELSTRLEDIGTEAFENVLQWIGTGKIIPVPETAEKVEGDFKLTPCDEEWLKEMAEGKDAQQYAESLVRCAEYHCFRHKLSQYFEFLIAADFLLIAPDPTVPILSEMGKVLKESNSKSEVPHDEFNKDTIAKVFQLPSKHPARKFMAQVCLDNYLGAKFDEEGGVFIYQEEMVSVPGFADQILDVMAEALAKPMFEYSHKGVADWMGVVTPVYDETLTIWVESKGP